MPNDLAGAAPRPSRREALGLGAAAVAAISLSACGIRLEDDAPRVPGVPTREPIAGEAFLLALWRHTVDLEQRARSLGGVSTALPARLAALHRDQAEVLRTELERLGIPETALAEAEGSPSATTTGSSTSATTTSTPTTGATAAPSGVAALAAEEASDLGPTAVASLARVPSEATVLVGAVLAQRDAAAALLGKPARWPEEAWHEPSLAAAHLSSTRSAVWGFEVVAAQSPSGAQHTLAASTLASLRKRAGVQESLAGGSAGPPDLAYPLPFPVTTPAAARRLAVHLLTELRAAVARGLGSAGGDTAALAMSVQWLGDTEVLASRWGVDLAPFPGLS